ncbi:MAG: GNAT family N-acetyltransferase [Burkholderiales bacterium]|nr:GNAT family N-acetyltransferase [Burkholderiales bacterium]
MHIRAARPEEAELLACIAWAAKASWGYVPAQLEAWREGLTPSAESIWLNPTYVAEIDGGVVGFYQVNLTARPVELDHLWVLPEHMRKGVGQMLMRHAITALASRGVAHLHIDSDPNAEPFYLAVGATRVGEYAAPIDGEPQRIRPQLRLSTPPRRA